MASRRRQGAMLSWLVLQTGADKRQATKARSYLPRSHTAVTEQRAAGPAVLLVCLFYVACVFVGWTPSILNISHTTRLAKERAPDKVPAM